MYNRDRCGFEYCAGSDFYFYVEYGCARGGNRNGNLTGGSGRVDGAFPDWKKSVDPNSETFYAVTGSACEEHHGTWSGRVHYVGHKLNGTDGVQRDAADSWRRCVCRYYDDHQFRA